MALRIVVADATHMQYTQSVCDLIRITSQQKGSGIVNRSLEYIAEKIKSGKSVIALDNDRAVGFSYIETWSHGMFVANSGLVVDLDYRYSGLARRIKKNIFMLSRKLYPKAKIFSITTGLAVMKINSDLGFVPVTFSELTRDIEFWKGCEGCKNFDILQRNDYKICLCTGLMFDPEKPRRPKMNRILIIPQKLPWRFIFERPIIFVKHLLRRQRLLRKRNALRKQIEQNNNNLTP
ncbi:MAG: GNAT family N-acetyltransferase [Bacteroidales bacterium]|nr:GNAT family N-acetyltransferase [Bacteroidales bacterium]